LPEISEADSVAVAPNLSVDTLLFYAYLCIRKRDSSSKGSSKGNNKGSSTSTLLYGSLDGVDTAIDNAVHTTTTTTSLLTSSAQYEVLDSQPFDPGKNTVVRVK
jgi:hypothetical protein